MLSTHVVANTSDRAVARHSSMSRHFQASDTTFQSQGGRLMVFITWGVSHGVCHMGYVTWGVSRESDVYIIYIGVVRRVVMIWSAVVMI